MDEAELRRLVADGVPEGRTVEYKLELGQTDQDKKEFLADVSSFANTIGGRLYLGIREENRVPIELKGLSLLDEDKEVQRLENLIRNGIEPRLPTLKILPVRLSSSRTVMVLDIPRSWALPHRVSLKGHDKFYARNSAGKYPVDVAELRGLFAQSEALAERMKRFRYDRLASIEAGETPLGSGSWAKLVLHLISVQAFEPGTAFDLSNLEQRIGQLKPLSAPGWNYRYNFEGLLTFANDIREGTTLTYLQVFRNGVLEAVDRVMLEPYAKELYIPGADFEREVAKSLPPYLAFLDELGVQPPVYIGLSLLGVKGYRMATREPRISRSPDIIDRTNLILPEIAVDDFSTDPFRLLRPVFDMIWNAAGWAGSQNYGPDGNWRGH